jgi:hypothetical protein
MTPEGMTMRRLITVLEILTLSLLLANLVLLAISLVLLLAVLARVISLNVQRRDLTAGQRAIVAARWMEQMPERRGRPGKEGKSSPDNGRSVGIVAKVFKVSDKFVQQAKALLAGAPDLAEQVAARQPRNRDIEETHGPTSAAGGVRPASV